MLDEVYSVDHLLYEQKIWSQIDQDLLYVKFTC